MKKVMLSIVLVVMAIRLAVAQTEQAKSKPVAQNPASGTQKPMGDISRNPMSPEMVREIEAAFVPTNEAAKNARKLFLAGKLIEAEAECRRAVFISPTTANGKPCNTRALQLFGEMCLLQKRNKEALESFLACYHNTRSTELDLDVALAYCRLGNYDMAMQWYSDQVLLQNYGITPQDLPGTLNLRSLEASVLLARGGQASGHAAYQEALIYFEAAGKLAPHNGLIASMTGEMLSNMGRHTPEYAPYFRLAAQYGHGRVAADAKDRVARFSISKQP